MNEELSANHPQPLLRVRELSVSFATERGAAKAVRQVSFDVNHGETVALVGESGSGKSVTSLAIMRLLNTPGTAVSGEALFHPRGECRRDLLRIPERDMQRLRGGSMGMIFQEPMTSLNPTMAVGLQVAEPLMLHQNMSKSQALSIATGMLKAVGISAPATRSRQYPHQLSGGMRQRVMIAMALACDPMLLIADEATTALDVTVQAQILELIRRHGSTTGMATLFVTHDLGVVAEIADKVVVMYGGLIVEQGDVVSVLTGPAHPYTIALRACSPSKDLSEEEGAGWLTTIPGQMLDPREEIAGCLFSSRCAYAMESCYETSPPLIDIGGGHMSRCLRYREFAPSE